MQKFLTVQMPKQRILIHNPKQTTKTYKETVKEHLAEVNPYTEEQMNILGKKVEKRCNITTAHMAKTATPVILFHILRYSM